MLAFRRVRRLATVFTASLAVAASVFAQGVTGTIAGTVKDAQGGVIPGATITLTSDTRGTASAPVVTNASGDFVFPNIVADTYTVQVEMASFRTLRQPGVSSAITGATRPDQLDETLKAIDIKLSDEVLDRIDEVLQSAPKETAS